MVEMKKVYESPEVEVVEFTISENITVSSNLDGVAYYEEEY